MKKLSNVESAQAAIGWSRNHKLAGLEYIEHQHRCLISDVLETHLDVDRLLSLAAEPVIAPEDQSKS